MRKVALSFEKNFLIFLVKMCKIVKVLSLYENDFHFYKELYIKKAFFTKRSKNGQGCAKF